jgi:REP element-mobilizing transposase RayT
MSYHQILYHIIFGTKYRKNMITEKHSKELYKYIWGIIKNKKCILYRINGVEDHIHLLISLHPSVALADLLKDLKVSSSIWMKQSGLFPDFAGWQEGYAAFTCSFKEKDKIIQYIKKQKEHHQKESFLYEYKRFLNENQIDFDEKYLP